MRSNSNITANYASRLWAGISTFVFVPLYLRLLGPEAFGLITFSSTLLGIVFVVDLGLSNTFAREMARRSDKQSLADLLRSLEWLYVGIIALFVIIAVTASGVIAEHWLNVSQLSPERVRWCVMLMLISAAIQVMLSLYFGGLLGSNRHVVAAAYQIGFGLVRSGIVLIPLYFWPVIELVFVWQLAAAAVCVLLLRRTIWRMIEPPNSPGFSRSALLEIRAFAGGMFGILLISAINTQSDKLVVSKIFTLDELGLYAIAGLVGQIPSMLALPLAVTVLPRLTSLIVQGETTNLVSLYMRYSYMISMVAFTAALGILVGAPQILTVILGSTPSAELVTVCRVLALGGAMLAAQFMPYHLAIASGHTRTNLVFGAISATLLPPTMFVCATRFGLIGAAIPWLVMNSVAAAYLAHRITPRFLGTHLAEWVWKSNLLPLAVAAALVGPVALATRWTSDPFIFLAALALFCGAAVAINAVMLARFYGSLTPPEQGRTDLTS